MKRILLLISFICLFAIVSVTAEEGAAYTAAAEPVLIQQSLGQYFGIGKLMKAQTDPSITDFCIFVLYPVSFQNEAAAPEMNLNGTVSNNQTNGRMTFTNYSPGIVIAQETSMRFLC
jgi:hypothetical protein